MARHDSQKAIPRGLSVSVSVLPMGRPVVFGVHLPPSPGDHTWLAQVVVGGHRIETEVPKGRQRESFCSRASESLA